MRTPPLDEKSAVTLRERVGWDLLGQPSLKIAVGHNHTASKLDRAGV